MERSDNILEKRKHLRVKLDAYITTTLTDDDAFQERLYMSKDVSADSIFLVSKGAFPIGTIFNLKIHPPTTLKPINVEAKVTRIAKDQNSQVVGMGLVFIRVDGADRKELCKYLYLAYHYLKD